MAISQLLIIGLRSLLITKINKLGIGICSFICSYRPYASDTFPYYNIRFVLLVLIL